MIKDFREKNSMSVQEMSEYFGITRQTIYHWQWGKTPTPKWASLVLDVLDRKTGQDIRSFRKKHKMTAEELARDLGLDRQTIYNWESGRKETPRWVGIVFARLDAEYRNQKDPI
jgi:DNA-binding XRE family transcriptional regulator